MFTDLQSGLSRVARFSTPDQEKQNTILTATIFRRASLSRAGSFMMWPPCENAKILVTPTLLQSLFSLVVLEAFVL